MIDQILEKLGLKSIDDLTPAERETYRGWSQILAKPDVTLEDLKKILPKELTRAQQELYSHKNTPEKDSYYKAYCGLLEWITQLIVSQSKQRDDLRVFLKKKFDLPE